MTTRQELKETTLRFEDRMHAADAAGNSVFYELSRQLLLADTVLLSLSSPVLASDKGLVLLEQYVLVFSLAWVLLVFSLIAGLLQLLLDRLFFLDVSSKMTAFRDAIREEKPPAEVNRLEKEYSDGPTRSNETPAFIQGILLMVGLILLVTGMILAIW